MAINKKEKLKIISKQIFKTAMQFSAFWVIGMSIVLLTNLYVDSELPNKGIWAIVWLLGCIEILFWLLISDKRFANGVKDDE